MNFAAAALAFAPALALGSFLNVVAARLPEARSLSYPSSTCTKCGTAIRALDNVPVISFLLLRGRCRSCHESIGIRYPLVELATGLLIAACFLRFGLTGKAFVGAFFVAVLVVLSAIDAERKILPDKIVLPAFVIVLVAQIALFPDRALEWVLSALLASLFLFVALLAYPRGMGMGDVKLALLLGAALGKSVAVGMMLGMITALVVGVAMIVRDGLGARKTAIAFGPFLAFGSIIAYFFGEQILDAYLNNF